MNSLSPSLERIETPTVVDPARLSLAQLRALGGAAGRELAWGLRQVSREVETWRRRAERIPDPSIRADALGSLVIKRPMIDGAAFFWTLPSRRDPRLLRLLACFQVAANFLDIASELGAEARGSSGGNLWLALVDAVDIGGAVREYYLDHPWADDGGYLRALVAGCRAGCVALARYPLARELLVQEARRVQAVELGHDPDPVRRDESLVRFAQREYGPDTDAAWFELTAGASSELTVVALLALASDERTTDADLRAAVRAYTWVGGLSTMLDSYVDQAEDVVSGAWSSIAYYADAEAAGQRIAYLIDRALREVSRLRHPERHKVVVTMMVALYLSHDSAGSEDLETTTRRFECAGGSLTRMLVPVLRLWRTGYRLRAA